MKVVFSVLFWGLCVLFLGGSVSAEAYVFLDELPYRTPSQVYTDNQDRFILRYGNMFVYISDKIVHKFSVDAIQLRNNNTEYFLTKEGKVYAFTAAQDTSSKVSHYAYELATCVEGKCSRHRIAKWEHNPDQNSNEEYNISWPVKTALGDLLYKVAHKPRFSFSKKVTFWNGTREIKKSRYDLLLTQHKAERKATLAKERRAYRVEGENFYYKKEKLPLPSERSHRYMTSQVYDSQGMPHLFFHDPENRSFYHRYYSLEEKKVIEVAVDQEESGQENLAFLHKDQIWSIHYFYRDPFNKGLLATIQKPDGQIESQFVFDASRTKNTGWGLKGFESPKKRILLSYITDKANKKRAHILLNDISELQKLSMNLRVFADIRGGNSERGDKKLSSLGVQLSRAHLEENKKVSITGGLGLQKVNWSVSAEGSRLVDGVDPEYEVDDSIMHIANIEGRVYSTNFGASLTSGLVDEVANTKTQGLSRFSGFLGWDRLFFNFAVKFQYEATKTKVLFHDTNGNLADRRFDLAFQEFKLSLMTFQRWQFGIVHQRYNLFHPITNQTIAPGGGIVGLEGQSIGDMGISNWGLHLGYSTLDYVTRFETNYSDWYFDGEIKGGISNSEWRGTPISFGEAINDIPSEQYFGFQGELGWIWYKRWQQYQQLGGAIKLAYRFDMLSFGSSSRSSGDEEGNSLQRDTIFSRNETRHGPVIYGNVTF